MDGRLSGSDRDPFGSHSKPVRWEGIAILAMQQRCRGAGETARKQNLLVADSSGENTKAKQPSPTQEECLKTKMLDV
jgi:hypothetical protein